MLSDMDKLFKALRLAAGKIALEHSRLQRVGNNEKQVSDRVAWGMPERRRANGMADRRAVGWSWYRGGQGSSPSQMQRASETFMNPTAFRCCLRLLC